MGNKNKIAKNNTLFGNIKSLYISRNFGKNQRKKLLKIIKYNKSIQKRLNKDIIITNFIFLKMKDLI